MFNTSGCKIETNKENNGNIIGKKIIRFDTIDSTNKYAKSIASEDAADGTVIIAAHQSKGRGRLGREWVSADNNGLYLSIIVKPDLPVEKLQIITLMTSVAVVEAIEFVTGLKAGIKWPNDILFGDKKVCGILVEMVSEDAGVNSVIIGIGVNVELKSPGFPEELKNRATSILAYVNEIGIELQIGIKEQLLEAVLIKMGNYYSTLLSGGIAGIIDKWREYSITLGKDVVIKSTNSEYFGLAVDILEDGRLVVLMRDGTRMNIQSGEVSVRGLMGYV